MAAVASSLSPCLCLFDVDRTLTAKQGFTNRCPGSFETAVQDEAYDGGNLTLSVLIQHLDATFCRSCYLGIISAGKATDQSERSVLWHWLSKLEPGVGTASRTEWTLHQSVDSPFVMFSPRGHKQDAVPGIIEWYRKQMGLTIPDNEVFFFDDRRDNVNGFLDSTYNARQISCLNRDRELGLCGAALDEVTRLYGVITCPNETVYVLPVVEGHCPEHYTLCAANKRHSEPFCDADYDCYGDLSCCGEWRCKGNAACPTGSGCCVRPRLVPPNAPPSPPSLTDPSFPSPRAPNTTSPPSPISPRPRVLPWLPATSPPASPPEPIGPSPRPMSPSFPPSGWAVTSEAVSNESGHKIGGVDVQLACLGLLVLAAGCLGSTRCQRREAGTHLVPTIDYTDDGNATGRRTKNKRTSKKRHEIEHRP